MPPITRKRRAPVEDNKSSKNEHSGVTDKLNTFSTRRKRKCPVDKCGKLFDNSGHLRVHYRRAHSKKKPYKCTFQSCDHACAHSGDLNRHIRNVHRQSKGMAKKYVKVRQEILAKETKMLGIKNCFTKKVNSEGMSEDDDDSDATVTMSTLPHFTTIHRTSTGHFICPLNKCDQQTTSIRDLKNHYRVHCASNYRPYRCIFPDDHCRYAAIQKSAVESHIRAKHFNVPSSIAKWNETGKDDDRNESDFVDTRIDWLEMENALFGCARIVSAPKMKIPRTYACTFANCTKRFNQFTHLRRHLRTHSQSKPFKCSFSDCGHSSTQKVPIFRHIQSAHFNVTKRKYKNLSTEKKQRAEQFVEVNQDILDKEEAQLASIRIGPRKSRRKRNCQSTNTGPNYFKVPFEDEETSEDEDDKDKLTTLLANVQPTAS